jgi:hypothetical protein
MPQLRSCYFCGAVGDSLQEYEVVPDRLVASGESRSAVLCSSCQEKLRRVLEPLVEAAESTGSTAGPDPGVSGVGEVTFESASPTPEDASVATDGRDADDETSEADEDEGVAPDDEDADAGRDEDVPDGYYKVLRLLQNREFPMERADLTALITGAYDVSEPQCERILETAIERGVLIEDGSTLDIGGD